MGSITVVGLGPADDKYLTLAGAEALRAAGRRIVRTARHDVVRWMQREGMAYESLDALYEQSGDFDTLNRLAADAVIEAAAQDDVVYAVPGAADLSDETLCRLAARGAVDVWLFGVSQDSLLAGQGLQHGENAHAHGRWQRCCAAQIADCTPDVTAPLLVSELKDRLCAGEVKIRLQEFYPDAHTVLLLRGETACAVPLYALDRVEGIDHAAAVYVPCIARLESLSRFGFAELCRVVERLRAPGGCPWDGAQTHQSIEPYLIEEAYEALDAIRRGDEGASIEELGDLLLQIVFHASIAAQQGEYDIRDVTSAVCEKMIHRHPRVFCDVYDGKNWEELKNEEKGFVSVSQTLADVPRAMPSLMRVQKLQKRSGLDEAEETCVQAAHRALEGASDARALCACAFWLDALARRRGVNLEMELAARCDEFCAEYARQERAQGQVDTGAVIKRIFG